MKIAFIGLGVMGKPMAKNLCKAGHQVRVYDHHPENIQELVKCGAVGCRSSREAAEGVECVITMLPDGPQVREVMLTQDRVMDVMETGTVFVDCSSISPVVSREMAAALKEKGIYMLDAPVSGGEPMAIAGTLSLMVGGDAETFARMQPVLACMGKSVVHCGRIGAGNVTKLCNQTIVAVNLAAVSEALQLGQMCGVEPEKIVEAIQGGLAGSQVLSAKAPMMMDQNFQPGFRIDLHIKDLCNVVDAAKEVSAPIPLTQSALEMMKVLHHDGKGGLDHSGLIQYYEKLSGEVLLRHGREDLSAE